MNSRLRIWAIKVSPEWALNVAKRFIKNLRKQRLKQQRKSGGLHQQDLEISFRELGIGPGDSVLVHSSLSKIGYVQGGALTVIRALEQVIGEEGTLLMPSFPASGRHKDYLESGVVFDLLNTPSAMGIITETFRTMNGVLRSLHPTDPVCAKGPLAGHYTNSHFGQLTPYTASSPFQKLAAKNGKILMLGTTLNGAGTSLHCLEDAVDFPYPVYDEKIFDVTVVDEKGEKRTMRTKVHNPIWSAKRNCDALVPVFEKEGVLKHGKTGDAHSMLLDAGKMLEVMIRHFHESGVTMYTPRGVQKKSNG